MSGPVYLAFNTNASLPGLIVMLPPPVGLRVDGVIEATPNGLRNTFASNPDLPLTSFTLAFQGGANGPVKLSRALCDPKTSLDMNVKLTAHNGKVRQFKQEMATPGCDPLATVKLMRHKKRYTLAALMTAARQGPALTAARLVLPKSLRTGKSRPRLLIDGRKVAGGKVRRALNPKLGSGVRRIKVVWKGLRRSRGKRIGKKLTIPVRLKDTRGKTTTLKLHVRVKRA